MDGLYHNWIQAVQIQLSCCQEWGSIMQISAQMGWGWVVGFISGFPLHVGVFMGTLVGFGGAMMLSSAKVPFI